MTQDERVEFVARAMSVAAGFDPDEPIPPFTGGWRLGQRSWPHLEKVRWQCFAGQAVEYLAAHDALALMAQGLPLPRFHPTPG